MAARVDGMTTRQVLDWSNWTGIPDPAHLSQVQADGWDAVILGTQSPSVTRQQYAACDAAGLPVEALYVFVYWDSEDTRRINDAFTLAEAFNLKVWLDCEWTMTGYPGTGTWAPDAATLVRLIAAYRAQLTGVYAGIYTGRWWWVPFTGDSHAHASDPLWHADYSTPDFDGFEPYGGWTRPTIWQLSSAGVDGVNADLNEEEERIVAVPNTPPTPQQQADALHELAYFIYRGWNLADLSADAKRWTKAAIERVPA